MRKREILRPVLIVMLLSAVLSGCNAKKPETKPDPLISHLQICNEITENGCDSDTSSLYTDISVVHATIKIPKLKKECEFKADWFYDLNSDQTLIGETIIKSRGPDNADFQLVKNLDSGWLIGEYTVKINSDGCDQPLLERKFQINSKNN